MIKIPTQTTGHLKDIPLFEDLSSSELKTLDPFLREAHFQKGEMLFLEGDPCQRVVIVVQGRVKMFRVSAQGKEQILEVLEGGDTCACNPGTSVWSCSASAQALTDCEILYLSRAHYSHLLNSNHKLALRLNKIFANRLCRFCSLIEEVSLDAPRRRLAKFILDALESKERKQKDHAPDRISMTHEEISQRVGLVRETVTRHLQHLRRSSIVDLRPNTIIIRDRQGLDRLVHA